MSTHEPNPERKGEVRAAAQSGERTDAGIHLGAEKYMKEDHPRDNPAYDPATGRQTGAGVPPSQREMGDRQREAGTKQAYAPDDEYVKAAVVPAPAPSAEHLTTYYPGMYPEVEEQERRKEEARQEDELERVRRHAEHKEHRHHHHHHHHHHRQDEPRRVEREVEVRRNDGQVLERAREDVMGDSWQGPDVRNPERSRQREVPESHDASREHRVREEVTTRDRDAEPRQREVREERVRDAADGERREVREEKVKDTGDSERHEVREKRVSDDGEQREERHVEHKTDNPRKGYKMSEAYADGQAVHMDAKEESHVAEEKDDDKEVHREETKRDDGHRRTETKKEIVRDRDEPEGDRRQGHVEEDVVSRPPKQKTEGDARRVDIGGESQGEMHERTDVKMPEYNEEQEMADIRAAEEGATGESTEADREKIIAQHASIFPDDDDEHKKGGIVHKIKHVLHLDRSERKAEKERKKEAEAGFEERQEMIQHHMDDKKAKEVKTEEKVETPDGETVREEKVNKEKNSDGDTERTTVETKEKKEDRREPTEGGSVREKKTVETRDNGSVGGRDERNTETREKVTESRDSSGSVREERHVERQEGGGGGEEFSRREEKTVKPRESSPSRSVTSQGVQTSEGGAQPASQGNRDNYEGGAVSNARQNQTVPLEILNPEGMERKAREDEILKSGQNYAEMDFRQPHEEHIPRDRIERMVEVDHKRKAAGIAPDPEVMADNFQVAFHTADSMDRMDQVGQQGEKSPPRRDSSYRR